MTSAKTSPGLGSRAAKWICVVASALGAALEAQTILVKPYVQPGDGATLGQTDVKVIAWLTDPTPGAFTVEFGRAGQAVRVVQPERTAIEISASQRYLAYAAKLSGLPLNGEVHYRVKRGDEVIGENTFPTRKTPDQSLRFVVTGDIADHKPPKFAIAFQMASVRPEFILVCGDIAYNRGRFSEYLANFWPTYCNGTRADPAAGAPLMQSVPFYMALGNHDVELADLAKVPDAFAAFYFFHPPRNAPPTGSWRPFIPGTDEQVRRFEAAATVAGYPYLCLYSFDNGPAHFLALDSDAYLPLLSADYREWIRRDLMESKARWKMVFFHHPGFQASATHTNQQRMRLLAPLFEAAGVDVVFAGHVHNYQRSKPLRFMPKDALPELGIATRGTFKLDEQFDGVTRTIPDGVLYIVTGAGGADLYAMGSKQNPNELHVDPDAPTSVNAKFMFDRHSFTVVDVDPQKLVLRQIDERGTEVDQITVTKPRR